MTNNDDPRLRLLEAAGQVFADKGFDGATVRDIIGRAGTNVAAVNYYFGDKEKLYYEAVRSAACCQDESFPMPEWPGGTPASIKLRDFIYVIVHRMLDPRSPPWKRQLFLREMTQETAACQALVRDHIRPMAETLAAILKELLPDAPQAKRNLIAFSIVGQCLYHKVSGPIAAQLVGPDEYRRYDADMLTEHITEFSFAALGIKCDEQRREE